MAGAMRKMAVYLGLVEDEEHAGQDYDYGYEGYDSGYGEAYEEREAPVLRHPAADQTRVSARPEAPSGAVRYSPPQARGPAAEPADIYRITTLHPRTYNEARTIGEHFREGTPVIMNLTEMDDTDAKRLVDFAAGLIFGLRGSIERVTNKVFLLTPANVEITAEDKSRIAEGGFFNQS
ncbi:MAG TPA: cell division protein SepF [Mycobacteriales bacterium]|jgi:cell division inhibitor SepF|nr:cell division protein SepF [Mycobacteriales bacterium]